METPPQIYRQPRIKIPELRGCIVIAIIPNHGVGEYIKGKAHTNGVESFWSMLKRGHAGGYHKMSKKHLQRYIDEYVGRHNVRPLATIEQIEITFKGMNGKRLKYEELIS